MVAKRDYYEVLGVSKQADLKEIKNAFRELAMRFHPDRNKEPGADNHFMEIAEAYTILSDLDKKQQYDIQGFQGISDVNADDFGPSFFDRFFTDQNFYQRRGADLETRLEVPLSKVMSGGSENIKFEGIEKCSLCKGSGTAEGVSPQTCQHCSGSGKFVSSRSAQNIMFQQVSICPTCLGKGVTIEKTCGECLGQGQYAKEKTIEVLIPPGIEDGTILRIENLGLADLSGKGYPGDLIITIQTKKDPNFQRAGPDLYYFASIPVYDAVLGTKLHLPSLPSNNKEVTVTVPSGTRPQTFLRLKGKGLPKFQGTGHGDLLIEVDIKIPQKLKAREKQLYEELRALEADINHSRPTWFSKLRENHDRSKSG